ncbi:ABC transporter substrate-binding protein [Amaricoccus macauensis]|uniref:ABC transporter substrate-binding protein n=1 Tax=Amaricoccus macauensis TaxID=57001 RepID=UPI003C7AFC52
MHKFVRSVFAASMVTAASPLFAEQGITADEVSFAQVAALDGPAAALGTGMELGVLAAFNEANKAGGVSGRRLSLQSFDDGYEPEKSVNLVREVIEGDDHIGFIGSVGTPTALATQPIATEAGFAYIGPFTGAGFLRDAALTNVVNIRATYADETEAWIAHLVDDLGMKKVALLYQDDGFGRVGLDGVTAALDRRGMSLVAQGSYTRNTTAVKSALIDIRKAEPEAVVMVGAYKPVAEFIRLSRKLKFEPTFVNISFVGSDALASELGPDGEGVIISQVVPFPWDTSLPIIAEYQAALVEQASDARPGFVSLEGYIVGRVAIEALKSAGNDLTRESYLEALGSLGTLDLGGLTLTYGPGDNQGSDSVFLTRINADGTFEVVEPGSSLGG